MPNGVVFCSTGLSSAERLRLEDAIGKLGLVYDGNLTDRTTHLVATRVHSASEKIKAAHRLGLPIVLPRWVLDGAEAGRLGPLHGEHLAPSDEVNAPKQPLADSTNVSSQSARPPKAKGTGGDAERCVSHLAIDE